MSPKYQIHEAIKNQNVGDVIRLLTNRHSSVNVELEQETSARYGLRPIHFAVEYGGAESAAVIDALREANADMNAKTRDVRDETKPIDMWTPLFMAVNKGHFSAALALLNCGAKPNIASCGWMPLHRAAEDNNMLMIDLLVDRGGDVNAKSRNQRMTPLHSAVVGGAVSACCALWTEGADLSIQDIQGRTPLDLAISREEFSVAETLRLLASIKGPRPKPISRSTERLQKAIEHQNIEQVVLLVERIAALGGVDFPLSRDGQTGLHWSALLSWPDGIEAMLAQGANLNVRDRNGWTPLMALAGGVSEYRCEEPGCAVRSVELLIDAKADVEGGALSLAASRARLDIVKVLLMRGANIQEADADGKTVLMYAAESGKGEVVELLLASGADQDARNNQGYRTCELPSLDSKIVSILESWRVRCILDNETVLSTTSERLANGGSVRPKGIL